MNPKDIYWLAGLLEGEGCFYRQFHTNPAKGTHYYRFCIGLDMTDMDIMERVAKLWGRNISTYVNKKGCKLMFRTSLSGDVAISWMFMLYPLMGIRRKAKIKELVAQWKEYNARVVPSQTHCKRGHLLPTDRKCLTCIYENRRLRALNKVTT